MKGKRVRAVAVIAVAASLLTMAWSTASASATTTKLCSVNTSPCPAAKTYGPKTTFKTPGFFFIGGEFCEFVLDFRSTATSGAPLPAEIFLFQFFNCPPAFSITAVNLDWSFPISVFGTGPNGTAEILPGGAGPVKLDVDTPTPGHCIYEFSNFPVDISGGSYLSSSPTGTLASGGSGCPHSLVVGFEGIPAPELYVTD